MRRTIRTIHLVLALVGGLLLSVVTVSGSAVAFRTEIDHLHASSPSEADGRADLDAVIDALGSAYPSADIQRFVTPEAWSGGLHEWWLRDDHGTPRDRSDDESWKVFTDPATGTILGDTRGSTASAALAWLAMFHHNLWLGNTGLIIIGSSGLCLLGFVVTGLWLWWPGLRRLRSGFTVRWNRGAFLRHFDLHKVLGVVGIPLFLITAITGSLFAFNWMRAAVHTGLGGTQADLPLKLVPQDQRPKSTPGTGAITWGTAVATAEDTAPTARVAVVMPPRGDTGTWTVLMAEGWASTGAYTGLAVRLDRYTGAVISTSDPRTMSAGGWINSQVWGLHVGTWGGLTTRILHTISGLLPPVLLFTGIAIWWCRLRMAQQVRQLRKVSAALSAPESPESAQDPHKTLPV